MSMILPVHPKTTDQLHQLLVGGTKDQGVKAWIALFALILEQGKNFLLWDKYSVSILSLFCKVKTKPGGEMGEELCLTY